MSLLLYGIIAENTLPNEPRLDARNVHLIHAEGLTAVTAQCEEAGQDMETVLAFGRVIESIHQNATIIPMRYGSLLPDEAAVIGHLTEKASHYRQRLEELDGCDEMGIRLPLALPEPEATPVAKPKSGHAYLQSLKRKYSATEQAEKEAADLALALQGLFRKSCGEAGLFANQPMYLISYLVPRTQLESFRAKVDELFQQGTHKGIISGPWPPYNFAG